MTRGPAPAEPEAQSEGDAGLECDLCAPLEIMVEQFPIGLDFAWVACDAAGHVAVFTNAGTGPIPASALADRQKADRTESLLRELQPVGSCILHAEFPRPDDWVGWAERGFFAYDWHFEGNDNANALYRIVSTPKAPRVLEDLPDEIRAVLVPLPKLTFAISPAIHEVELGECLC